MPQTLLQRIDALIAQLEKAPALLERPHVAAVPKLVFDVDRNLTPHETKKTQFRTLALWNRVELGSPEWLITYGADGIIADLEEARKLIVHTQPPAELSSGSLTESNPTPRDIRERADCLPVIDVELVQPSEGRIDHATCEPANEKEIILTNELLDQHQRRITAVESRYPPHGNPGHVGFYGPLKVSNSEFYAWIRQDWNRCPKKSRAIIEREADRFISEQ